MQSRTVHRQAVVFVLATAFGVVAGLADAAQIAARHPPELPVVTLDGLPGTLGMLSGAPQRPAPTALPSLPVTRLDDRTGAADLDAPRLLSLTFARPLPVRDVLLLLFRGTPFSVVVDPGVSGTFAGELKNLSLRQALESVLRPAGLDYDADATVLRIFPRKVQTRWFGVDHLAAPRAGLDYFADVGGGVQTLLSASGKYHVNRKASLVQVTDFADRLDLVAAYLEASHIRVSRQVRIQARIFEVARADGTPIDWTSLASRAGSGIRPVAGAAGWRVDDGGAWLRTIAAEGSVRHIAAPAVLAMNNEPAMLRAEDTGAPLDLRLTVTPQIAADRNIHLYVALSPEGEIGARFTSNVDTVLRIADGDTVILAGLLRQREGGRSEVVVLISATAVTPGSVAGGGR